MTLNNFIYRVEWKGAYSDWVYRLDIKVPPSDIVGEITSPADYYLNDPYIYYLSPLTVQIKDLDQGYEDYLGFPKTSILKLSIDLDEIPAILKGFLLNDPVEQRGRPMYWWSHFNFGVVFELYIQYNGISTLNPVPFSFFGAWVYYGNSSYKLDWNNSLFEIEAEDVNVVALKSLQFADSISFMYWTELTDFLVDMAFIEGGNLEGLIEKNKDIKYGMLKYNDLLFFLKDSLNFHLSLLRRQAMNADIEFTLPTYYQQPPDITGVKGNALTEADLYFIHHIEEGVNREIIDDTIRNHYQNDYPNSVYDFLNELADFTFKKACLSDIAIGEFVHYNDMQISYNSIYSVKSIEKEPSRRPLTNQMKATTVEILKSGMRQCVAVEMKAITRCPLFLAIYFQIEIITRHHCLVGMAV
mgnify:CR=1 FL=1